MQRNKTNKEQSRVLEFKSEQIEKLIAAKQWSEAFALIKPLFSGSVKHATFKLLDQIVSGALADNDITLAATAATYREGYFAPIEVSEAASWNSIIKKAN